MKILQINSVCGIRSTGRICTDIADLLNTNGHECKIAYGRNVLPDCYNFLGVKIGTKLDVFLHLIITRIFDRTGFGSKRSTKKFLKWVEEYNPDVIHIHNLHGYYIHIGLLFNYIKKYNKPVVWTLHDCWAFTGHCSHFDYINCQKWSTGGCFSCPKKHNYPSSFVFDNSKSNFKRKQEIFSNVQNMTVVAPSKWLGGLVEKSYLHNYPIKVIKNGIDLLSFKPTFGDFRIRYNLQNQRIILGVASNWNKSKGFDDFKKLNALKRDDETIVLVGLTDEQLDELPDGMIGIKRSNNIDHLAEIYSAADIFVNLSYQDTYPTVNLEAQACGTPVVTYCTGGSPESVPDDNVVPRGDIIAVIDKIHKMFDKDTPQIADVTSFSRNECFEAYIDLYRSIIDN